MYKRKPAKIISQIESNGKDKHIMVLMGGESNEREVSLSSGNGIVKSLERLGYKVTAVDMGFDVAKIILDMNPDVVFIALHGTYGEDGAVQGLLEVMRIPYTHSGILSSSVSLNKEFFYNIMQSNGILQPKRVIIDVNRFDGKEPIPVPYVIKPISEGSSIGVSVVLDDSDYSLTSYIGEFGNKYGDRIIVEEYIPGREIQVAIVGNKAIGAIEIRTNRPFYDYIAKYTEGASEHIMPAPINKEKYEEVMSIAESIHNIMMCDNISRVDFRYNDDPKVDKFYALEINTHPGFTPSSLVPEIASYHNISYDELVEILIGNAKCYSVTTNT